MVDLDKLAAELPEVDWEKLFEEFEDQDLEEIFRDAPNLEDLIGGGGS